jgi:PAS domain S-box-containing protein
MDRPLDQQLVSAFKLIAKIAALVVVVAGIAVVTGRVLDTESSPLTFASGGVGLSFLFFGLAVLALTNERFKTISRPIGYCLTFLAFAVGALNFGRYFFGLELVNTFADLELFGFQPAVLLTMSPSDCILVTTIGIALFMVDITVKKVRPTEVLAFFAMLGCLMTILGVILRIDSFCMFTACARISYLTGFAFAILCLSVLLSRPGGGLVSLLASPNAGGIAARRLIPSAVAIPIIVSWIRMGAEKAGLIPELGLTLMVASMVVLFALLLWWNSWTIEEIDYARQEAMLKVKQSEKRTRMIVQQAIDAFVAVDINGQIKDWNEQAFETFGWTKEEILDKSILDFVIPARYAEPAKQGIQYLITNAKGTISNKPIETFAMRKDGTEFPVELSLFPVIVESELILCAFARDITERKAVEQRFKEFYSTVSHELRSPLTSMRGSMALVQELAADMHEAAKEMLQIADRSLDRLIRLINDLLDVKRIEEGQLKLELQALDPINIASLAIDGLRGLADRSDVGLEIVVDETATFIGDADRIVQVITNLVSNAIKFSPKKKVVVLHVLKSKNPQMLRFQIEDKGPGIPQAQIKKLFNRFSQLADGKSNLGVGLGLAISRAIVEEHGGEVGVDSVVGEGTTFWFEVPLTQRPSIESSQMSTLSLRPLDVEA